MPAFYETVDDLPEQLPVFPLEGALLLPRGQLPLNIFEPRYLSMFEELWGGGACWALSSRVARPQKRARPCSKLVVWGALLLSAKPKTGA